MAGKRTLYIPPTEWDQLKDDAAQAGAQERRPVSVSEYVRRTLREKRQAAMLKEHRTP